jgi:hypothetical protein
MQWAACIYGEVCENACRGKACGRFGESSKSNNPGKEKNRPVITARTYFISISYTSWLFFSSGHASAVQLSLYRPISKARNTFSQSS